MIFGGLNLHPRYRGVLGVFDQGVSKACFRWGFPGLRYLYFDRWDPCFKTSEFFSIFESSSISSDFEKKGLLLNAKRGQLEVLLK